MTPKSSVVMLLAIARMPAVPASARDNRNDRDFQWLFREHRGDCSRAPTTVFLSWNYRSDIFRASCGNGRGSVDLAYYRQDLARQRTATGELNASSFEPMGLNRGNKSKYAKVRGNGDRVEVSFKREKCLVDVLAPGLEEAILMAENPERDPCYVGKAAPLYQLVKACS